MLYLRVFLEPIGEGICGRLAGFSTDLVLRFLLAAAIADIPFAHDVDERRKLAAALIVAVNAVGNGDKAHSTLPKEDFRIESCLQVVPPDTAHILGNHAANFSCLNVGYKLFPARALEVCAAPTVVCVVCGVLKSMLGGVAFQHGLLIHDGIAVPDLLIIMGQSLV